MGTFATIFVAVMGFTIYLGVLAMSITLCAIDRRKDKIAQGKIKPKQTKTTKTKNKK
jgi:hypothetical protein